MAEVQSLEEIVERLELERIEHEGGWFRRIYTGNKGADDREQVTTIYALFSREEFSALHKLDASEQFFFLDGDPFEVFRIDSEGNAKWELLGKNASRGESPHLVFEPGEWFGGRTVSEGDLGWTLMSCVVTPGFRWEGFELGQRQVLLDLYPNYGDAIRALTRV